MDNFKKETVKDMTAWDLNCRSILPHSKFDNLLEKKIKRKARRKYKIFLREILKDLSKEKD